MCDAKHANLDNVHELQAKQEEEQQKAHEDAKRRQEATRKREEEAAQRRYFTVFHPASMSNIWTVCRSVVRNAMLPVAMSHCQILPPSVVL